MAYFPLGGGMMWKDSETELDFLDFDYLIDTISNIIKNDNLLPSTIGVYGDWGSGKSSLINMSIEALKKEVPVFCMIDEIFRGTNPIERVASSAAILEYINRY